MQIKHIPSSGFSVARQVNRDNKPAKPPGKNWARAFKKRHVELKARKSTAIDWDYYKICDKVMH
ncbi:hypothetical protein PSPO01_13572 [Paraphaeosphaeria sporulosa]